MIKLSRGAKFITEIVACTIDKTIRFDLLLEKYQKYKAWRILAWVNRFLHNSCYSKQADQSTTVEIQKQGKFYIKR